MNIIIMGPQGSGKSTQAELLTDKINNSYLYSGGLLREFAKGSSNEAIFVKDELAKGHLIPNEILFPLLEEKITETINDGRGFVLDGYPRNDTQLEPLNNLLSKTNQKIDKVLYINLPDQLGIDRIFKRAQQEGREDDTQEAISKRLEIYHTQTEPILDHYRKLGILLEVDGSGTIEEVEQRVWEAVQK